MKTRRGIYFLSVGCLLLGLSGCSRPPCQRYLDEPFVLPQQKLVPVPKPINVIQRRAYDRCILERYGVRVIQIGQTWTIVFPSDDVFDNETAEIRDDYKPLLDVAADFMQTYSKITVQVAAFTNHDDNNMKTKFGSVSDELTERQASSVANYLHSKNINARLLYSVGKGDRKPIAWDGSPDGRRFNRRVEVYFRYYRDNTAWY